MRKYSKSVYDFLTGNHKLVGAFTRNVYDFLRSFNPPSGDLDATIAAKSDVLPVVQKVLDSREPEARKPGKKGEATYSYITMSSFLK